MNSQLILRNITCIDHAIINPEGKIQGGSYHGDFIVTGPIEPEENVVIDFSRVKKEIKALIDHKEVGFDHKLWFIPGYSLGDFDIKGEVATITTPFVNLEIPSNAFRVFTETEDGECFISRVGDELGKFLTRSLQEDYPGVVVHYYATEDAFTTPKNEAVGMFTYAHGLKKSSSWGCQNIAHGHTSFIEIVVDDDAPYFVKAEAKNIAQKTAKMLDGTYFIFSENINGKNPMGVSVNYTTDRGNFLLQIPLVANGQKFAIIETETTIEWLLEWIYEQIKPRLEFLSKRTRVALVVSEGLAKGAVKVVPKA